MRCVYVSSVSSTSLSSSLCGKAFAPCKLFPFNTFPYQEFLASVTIFKSLGDAGD